MKTQNTNLTFNKNVIVDLSDDQLQNINGGTLFTTVTICTSDLTSYVISW